MGGSFSTQVAGGAAKRRLLDPIGELQDLGYVSVTVCLKLMEYYTITRLQSAPESMKLLQAVTSTCSAPIR
jgi:hypothetical protein